MIGWPLGCEQPARTRTGLTRGARMASSGIGGGRRLRFGIAGMTSDHTWGMGDGLAALPEVELVAGADPHEVLRQRASQQWGLQRTYADFGKMLASEELDAL